MRSMNYMKQFGIILAVTCVGEILRYLLPLPIPAGIYGLMLLLVLLAVKVIKLEHVENTADFLIKIMPLMFIPPAVGLVDSWDKITGILIPLCIIIPVSTCVVMIVTGKVADFVIDVKENRRKTNE